MARAAGETGNHGPERMTMGLAETEDRGTFQGLTTGGSRPRVSTTPPGVVGASCCRGLRERC